MLANGQSDHIFAFPSNVTVDGESADVLQWWDLSTGASR